MLHAPQPHWLQSIHHDGSAQYLSNATPSYGETVTLRLRAGANTPLKRVYLRVFPDGEQFIYPMQQAEKDGMAQWWQIEYEVQEPLINYRFILESEAGEIYQLNAAGVSEHVPLDHSDFKLVTDFQQPQWLLDAVFYQIFPDRFNNGDPATNHPDGTFNKYGVDSKFMEWDESPAPDREPWQLFYSGDLPGVTQKLDYLQDLGVTAIYLNPIFASESEHRYDVIDYSKIDPYLGGNAALIELREALDARDMHYILDIVPNHTGQAHPWLKTAQTDKTSEEYGFFFFNNHPDDYAGWMDLKSLPKLNYASQTLRERMYRAKDSVMRRWLLPPFRADGWRVDVANMLGRHHQSQIANEVIPELRAAVKATNPDAYLVAENFFDFSPGLQGDQWDAAMNYTGFSSPLWHWLRGYQQVMVTLKNDHIRGQKWSTRALAESWQTRMASVPWAVQLLQLNVLDSHDTERVATLAGNEALHKLAVALQFTFPGVPCVYYGDEIGLTDHPQLAQRAPMPWDETDWNHNLRSFYKTLAHLRRTQPALQTGGFQIVATEPDTIATLRTAQPSDPRILTLAHRAEAARPAAPLPVAHTGIADGTAFRNLFTGETLVVTNGALPLGVQGQGASVWIEQSHKP